MLGKQTGGTLVGELIALAIMGTALTLIIGGLSTMARSVGLVEQRTVAENYARQQVEAIRSGPYLANPTEMPYPTVSIRCPEADLDCVPVYNIAMEVSFWQSDIQTFQDAMPELDGGLQRITVTVHSRLLPDQPVFALETLKWNEE